MDEIEKILDYLQLLRSFDQIEKSEGMEKIFTAAGLKRQYIKDSRSYANHYLKTDVENLAKTFNKRADRQYIVNMIATIVKDYSDTDFVKNCQKELLAFLDAVEVFKDTKKLSLADTQKLNANTETISRAIKKVVNTK